MRLIDNSVIDKYLVNKFKNDRIPFSVAVSYIEECADGDYLEIVLKREKNPFYAERTWTTTVKIPFVREDGMLERNGSIFYPVYLVTPPIKFVDVTNITRYCDIFNRKGYGAALDDLLGKVSIQPVEISTPLLKELCSNEPVDIASFYNWPVISLPVAIVEMINIKIIDAARRSGTSKFKGIDNVAKAISVLINALTRYQQNFDIEIDKQVADAGISDKECVLYLHPFVETLVNFDKIFIESPIDFCTMSPSQPLRVARVKDGVTIVGNRFNGTPTFPYARFRRSIVGILNDDPHRVVVSRGIIRSMHVLSEIPPYVTTEVPIGLDTIILPGIRMTHPLTMEDGIIVSETFAEYATGFKFYTQKIQVLSGSEVNFNKEICPEDMESEMAMYAVGLSKPTEIIDYSRFIVKPGEFIGHINTDGQFYQITADISIPGVIVDITKYSDNSGGEIPMDVYKVVYFVCTRLTVGAKLTDAHGNKGTVSAIWPDEKMPKWNDIQVHYIASPYVMKRLAVGAEIEDKLALVGLDMRAKEEAETLVVDSSKCFSMEEVDQMLEERGLSYLGTVNYNGKLIEDVPLSLRMMFRVDNDPVDYKSFKQETEFDDDGFRISSKGRMSIDYLILLTKNANNIANDLLYSSKPYETYRKVLLPLFAAIGGIIPEGAKAYEITSPVDPLILGVKLSHKIVEETPVENTVLDPRCSTHYGVIRYGENILVVPPHNGFEEMGYGMYIVNDIAAMANRVLCEIASGGFTTDEKIEVQIRRYIGMLIQRISGRGGLLRDTIFPQFKHIIRAVASSFIGKDIQEIRVPRRVFYKLFTEEQARAILQRGTCLIKRDPVHRPDNFQAVKFRLWDEDTIGVHPVLIKSMDGDFDGDQVMVFFPTCAFAAEDIEKMKVDLSAGFKPAKQLYNATYDTINIKLHENIFGSSFTKPHESDECKRPETLNKLLSGLDMENAAREAWFAALDYFIIKRGTALVGTIGLKNIYLQSIDNLKQIERAMMLYHILAQNTLDAKAGVEPDAMKFVEHFRKFNYKALQQDMVKLGIDVSNQQDESIFKDVMSLLNTIRKGRHSFDTFIEEYNILLYLMYKEHVPVNMYKVISAFARDIVVNRSASKYLNNEFQTVISQIFKHYLDNAYDDRNVENPLLAVAV